MAVRMSDDWLRAQAQRESRVEYHGPRVALPVRKLVNEAAWVQTPRLRREAEERRTA